MWGIMRTWLLLRSSNSKCLTPVREWQSNQRWNSLETMRLKVGDSSNELTMLWKRKREQNETIDDVKTDLNSEIVCKSTGK
jgi:hypothetical protein